VEFKHASGSVQQEKQRLGPRHEGAGTPSGVTGGVSNPPNDTPSAPVGHLPQRGRQGGLSHAKR
jgi:hypothetical protein